MTHVMAKGANIALPVAAVRAVLRWHAAPGSPDVDASALLVGADGRVRSDADFVFYNQPRHPSGVVRHLPKHRTGPDGEIADTIEIELGKLPADVDRVVLAGSSEGGSFRAVPRLRVLLYDAAAGDGAPALAEFAVTDAEEVTALLAAELYRRDGGWKFRAVGQGYATGLVGLATDFGITVEDDAAPEAAAGPAEPTAPPAPHRAPDPRSEPGTYTLAPAVPLSTPPPPVAPPSTPPAPQPAYGYPQPPAQPAYGYPQQPYPQQPQPQPQPGYGYGYPPPPPAAPPVQPAPQEAFALPPQGPQFQPR
ncbi:TerD family protein [Kitasatospora sp. NPDC057223]|uniref:TerD family protein n=1 Tax=Kitasatospora sp. NPDC057223 TaxID=3346055 RepID=UPI003634A8FE